MKRLFGGAPNESAPPQSVSADDLLLQDVTERLLADVRVKSVKPLSGELGFVATTTGGDITGYLANLRVDVRGGSEGGREELISRYVRSLLDSIDVKDEPFSSAKDHIRVVLRPGDIASAGYAIDNPSACWEALPTLVAIIAHDRPDSIGMLRQNNLRDWGISLEEARAIAYSNMRKLPISLAHYDESASSLMLTIVDGDDYEAARLILPEWLEKLRGSVPGNPIVVAPTRSLVVIGGDGDPAMVERLLKLAKAEHDASSRSISCVPYVFHSDGVLRELELPAEHPLAGDLAMARYTMMANAYAGQHHQLTEYYEVEGIVRFVASYKVVQRDGKLASYAVWSRDVITSLPLADEIVLFEEGKEPKPVPLATLRAVCGSLLTVDATVFPHRLLTEGFPDAEMLAKL